MRHQLEAGLSIAFATKCFLHSLLVSLTSANSIQLVDRVVKRYS